MLIYSLKAYWTDPWVILPSIPIFIMSYDMITWHEIKKYNLSLRFQIVVSNSNVKLYNGRKKKILLYIYIDISNGTMKGYLDSLLNFVGK